MWTPQIMTPGSITFPHSSILCQDNLGWNSIWGPGVFGLGEPQWKNRQNSIYYIDTAGTLANIFVYESIPLSWSFFCAKKSLTMLKVGKIQRNKCSGLKTFEL